MKTVAVYLGLRRTHGSVELGRAPLHLQLIFAVVLCLVFGALGFVWH